MNITKDLTVVVTNDTEGASLTFKTVSRLGEKVVSISGDPSVYEIKDIEEALKAIKEFSAPKASGQSSPPPGRSVHSEGIPGDYY